MERLAKKDADAGVESRPLTDAQKAAIAEARNFYESKMAEQEVLHQSKMRATFDPAARETLAAGIPARSRAPDLRARHKIEKIRRG